MKILLIDLGRTGRLFPTAHLFRKKLDEAKVTGIEIATAEMAELGSPGERTGEKNMKEILLKGVDFIVVMEEWQKELLTRFMDYKTWGKIHLFADICKRKITGVLPSCDVDFGYRNENEKMSDGCGNLVEEMKICTKENPQTTLAF